MNPTILARLFQAQTDSIQAAQRASSPMPGGDDVALWSQPGQSANGDSMEGAIDPGEQGQPQRFGDMNTEEQSPDYYENQANFGAPAIRQEPGNLWPQGPQHDPIAAPPGAPPSGPPLGGMFGAPPASQRMATRRPA